MAGSLLRISWWLASRHLDMPVQIGVIPVDKVLFSPYLLQLRHELLDFITGKFSKTDGTYRNAVNQVESGLF